MNSTFFRRIVFATMFALRAVAFAQPTEAAAPSTDVDAGVSGEIRLVWMQSRDTSIQENLFSKELYLEKALVDGVAAYGVAYHDEAFESASCGIARQLGDFQLAIGVGKARYGDITHRVVNPWLYYHANEYTALLTAEHYSKERDKPWYYKGHIERKFGGSYLVGLFGEKDIGAGPMAGVYLGSQTRLWVSTPIVSRPNRGWMYAIFGLTVEF